MSHSRRPLLVGEASAASCISKAGGTPGGTPGGMKPDGPARAGVCVALDGLGWMGWAGLGWVGTGGGLDGRFSWDEPAAPAPAPKTSSAETTGGANGQYVCCLYTLPALPCTGQPGLQHLTVPGCASTALNRGLPPDMACALACALACLCKFSSSQKNKHCTETATEHTVWQGRKL